MADKESGAGSVLLGRTLALLKSDARSLSDIAKGAGLGLEWLRSLSAGRIEHPSVSRVERLYIFLSGKGVEL